MKYDREWLEGIRQTQELIERMPDFLNKVPFPHRHVLQRQFQAQVEFFKHESNNGLDTSTTQERIFDLSCLAVELVEEADKLRASLE